MHAAVVGVVAAQAWPALALAGAGLPILAHGVWTIRRHALRLGARAVVRLRFTGEETCEATHRDGSVESARIDGSSHVLAGMVVLRLRQAGRLRKRSIVLMPDAVAPDGLRRLRVRLRWGRLAEPRDAWNGWL